MSRTIKLYHPLALAGLLFLALSFFSFKQTLDVHLYDTYYVMPGSYVFRKIAIILISIAVLYRFTGSILFSVHLSRLHIILTLASAALLAGIILWGDGHSYNNLSSLEAVRQLDKVINLSIIVLLTGVLIYIINLLAGVIRRLM